MKTKKILEMADSFVEYFKKYNIKNISEDFIHDYYIFSNSIYISVV